jgi:D-alanine-D-alanine ligase
MKENNFGKIGVLMGGPSSERAISLKSGHAVYDALSKTGIDVVAIDIKTGDIPENICLIKSCRLDCVFIALHGRFGEDGQIQKILEDLKLPYTGSGVEASCLAMDKIASREIFAKNGLSVPHYKVLDNKNHQLNKKYNIDFELPLVIKPSAHGSSIGLSIIDRKEDLKEALDLAFGFDNQVIVEKYISGREITVGILDSHPLPVIEIVPKKRFFDYQAKYQPGMTEYIVPAQLEEDIARNAQEIALASHNLLGCYGCSRIDMILNEDLKPVVLEVNTIPGLTETSLLPKSAKITGIDFIQLCLTLIRLAYEKNQEQASRIS